MKIRQTGSVHANSQLFMREKIRIKDMRDLEEIDRYKRGRKLEVRLEINSPLTLTRSLETIEISTLIKSVGPPIKGLVILVDCLKVVKCSCKSLKMSFHKSYPWS